MPDIFQPLEAKRAKLKKTASPAPYLARSITEGPGARKRRPVPPHPVIFLPLHNMLSGRSAAILHLCCQTPLYRPIDPEFVTLDTRIAEQRCATRNAHR